jgi:hypothetical protein
MDGLLIALSSSFTHSHTHTHTHSLMDGLLIGLSAVAGQSAGLVMSVALTIEMGFLGLTFSAGVGKVSGWVGGWVGG